MQRTRLYLSAVAVIGAAWIGYLWWGHWGDASPAVWFGTAVPLSVAVLGAVIDPRSARAHTAIVAAVFLTLAVFSASRVIDRWPFEWDAMPDRRYAGFIAAAAAAVGIGLLWGAFWARWTAMAFSLANMLSGAVNAINMRSVRGESPWLAAITLIGSVTIWVSLTRPSVREHFARRTKHALWTSSDRLVSWVRWAAITSFATAPSLLLYALAQPVAPPTVVPALVLAPIVGLGSVLVVMRRAAGIVIVTFGGAALVAQTVATASYVQPGSLPIVGYYASFWIPTAIVSIVAGVLAFRRARGR